MHSRNLILLHESCGPCLDQSCPVVPGPAASTHDAVSLFAQVEGHVRCLQAALQAADASGVRGDAGHDVRVIRQTYSTTTQRNTQPAQASALVFGQIVTFAASYYAPLHNTHVLW